jgi:hypothetical protein
MDPERQSRRLQLDDHVRLENQHDLDGIMTTFGATPRYDDEPWNAHYTGRGRSAIILFRVVARDA